MTPYTIGTGFSGIGVPDLAAHLLGIDTLWQIERDANCLALLRCRFPDAEQIENIFGAHPPYADIEVFGFPCQPFSASGDMRGEEDERYLVPEMLRVIDETRPRVVVLENVPGFASIADGDTFRKLLRLLAEMGFDAEWGHLSASDFGAPHGRERWWLVAHAVEQRASGRWQRSNGAQSTDGSQAPQWAAHPAQAQRFSQARRRRHTHAVHREVDGPVSNPVTVRKPQPGLGRDAARLASGLDFRPFPSLPSFPPHNQEPPRVVKGKSDGDRSTRVGMLGNTMQLDVAYEVLQCVLAWLQEVDGVTP